MGKDQEADRREIRSLQQQNAESHRDVLTMLQTSAQTIRDDIHKVDVRVARMEERIEERGSLTEAFAVMSDKIVAAMRETRPVSPSPHHRG